MIKRVLNKWDFVKQKPKSLLNVSLLNVSYVNPEFTLGTDINNTLDFDESTNDRIRELVREEILRIIGTTENI